MDQERSNRRTDEQLQAILCDTGHWVVNGQQGRVLCFAASLARAIDRATEFATSGAVVTAICRLPSDNIIVFPGQMERLRPMLSGPVLTDDALPRVSPPNAGSDEMSLHY